LNLFDRLLFLLLSAIFLLVRAYKIMSEQWNRHLERKLARAVAGHVAAIVEAAKLEACSIL